MSHGARRGSHFITDNVNVILQTVKVCHHGSKMRRYTLEASPLLVNLIVLNKFYNIVLHKFVLIESGSFTFAPIIVKPEQQLLRTQRSSSSSSTSSPSSSSPIEQQLLRTQRFSSSSSSSPSSSCCEYRCVSLSSPTPSPPSAAVTAVHILLFIRSCCRSCFLSDVRALGFTDPYQKL